MTQFLYFGHPVNTYDTELEQFLISSIELHFPEHNIINPAKPHHAAAYQDWKARTGNGMRYFLEEVVPACQTGVFLPFRDGAWGKGVHDEAQVLVTLERQIWRIDLSGAIHLTRLPPAVKVLTVPETIQRIRTPDGSTVPY